MTECDMDTLLRFFKALANENRLKIVSMLSKRECGVGELASTLGLEEPTVSHHLAKLKDTGIVRMRVVGNDHLHRVDINELLSLQRKLFTSERVAGLDGGATFEAWEKKILKSFVRNSRITAIPVGYKKKLVVLKWLADKFEKDIRYPEKQVNAVINMYHEDHASLRRYLVDFGFMKRDKGIYWRIEWEMPEF